MRKYANEKSPLRGELFSTEQLEQYAISLAATHSLSKVPAPELLLKRLDENRDLLAEVHQILTISAQKNDLITPAGEWLLDNYYLIEEQIRIGKKHLPKGYSEALPRLGKGPSTGLPRVYDIALAIISHSDGRVDLKSLYSFVTAYQTITHLKLGELWAIPIMLRLALIENLRRLAAQLAIDRINKNLADYWADLMTETAEKDPKSLIVVTADMAKSSPPMTSSFVSEITRRLLGKGPALALPLTWIEQSLSENGLTSNALIHTETQRQAAEQVSMSNSIGSLRFLNNTDWRDFVEMCSIVESTLQKDPSGIYPLMDFRSRDHYRHIVENIAKHAEIDEQKVADITVTLAEESAKKNPATDPSTHLGYYLLGKGASQTEIITGLKFGVLEKLRRAVHKYPLAFYLIPAILITFILTGILFYDAAGEEISVPWLIIIDLISIIATSHLSVSLVNWLVTILIDPDFLPRLDFLNGIPPDSRTLVVVPTLFNSKAEIDDLMETMEVRYLANKDENLHFALLTDFTDATQEILPEDDTLLAYAKLKTERLNKKYLRPSNDTFFLFHRPRRWNKKDKIWMGYERKRGKLSELNHLIRGKSQDRFLLIVGEEAIYTEVKYVITLDTDTQLPRDAARKIIATIAHPLNRPHYDPKKKIVTEGYGILQPRLAVSLNRNKNSWYAKMFENSPGIDPYTRAVSDVYQDLMKEGSFIGKGIYDVDAFECALNDLFPENRILSHDLLEGCHARSGIINDVQLFEEYPVSYLADMQRRHRWIRGDWQIGRWLFPSVPGPGKHTNRNPLSALSRWKIFDNLRRSLVYPALLFLLLFGWLISDTPWFWTISVIGIIVPISILVFIWSLVKKPEDRTLLAQTVLSVENLLTQLIQYVFFIITLPYEAYVNMDAIIRTTWRMFVSHKKLLEWNPSVNVLNKKPNSLRDHFIKMWIGPILGLMMIIYLITHSASAFIISVPILILWIGSPFIAWFISLPLKEKQSKLSSEQKLFLGRMARKTWGYFENFVTVTDHWLPPDNFQEIPEPKVAHRTSPTNIGLALLSNLSAFDFGYITSHQLLTKCRQTLITMHSLERYKGHFYNWYDTLSLVPLPPKYISTVDS
ncbi:MAG: cyclic beta 1-2 glucan synthetase, partial [Saprospiraceae bacterium]